ncbi:MAG: hypothetical protein WDO15_11950 [Bacteroidota bacterium]
MRSYRPPAAAFQQEFPNQEKTASMMNYNKFSVSVSDIVGTWGESSTSALNMYNTIDWWLRGHECGGDGELVYDTC